MGFFKRDESPKDSFKSTAFLFSFTAPYDKSTTRQAILESLWSLKQYQDESGRPDLTLLDTPPLQATQYLSEVGDDRIILTAGNRINTFWTVTFSIESSQPSVTTGSANLDRVKSKIDRWQGNVLKISLNLPGVLARDYSFDVQKPDDTDEWVEPPDGGW